jgi:hypothetical protein
VATVSQVVEGALAEYAGVVPVPYESDPPPLHPRPHSLPYHPIPSHPSDLVLQPCGPQDQSSVEKREDVLVGVGVYAHILCKAQHLKACIHVGVHCAGQVYTSDVLVEPVAITGDVVVQLFVQSTANGAFAPLLTVNSHAYAPFRLFLKRVVAAPAARALTTTDTDFVVKITDVFPSGDVSMLVQDSIVRMRWRNGGTEPSLLTPGQVYNATIDIGCVHRHNGVACFLGTGEVPCDVIDGTWLPSPPPRFS